MATTTDQATTAPGTGVSAAIDKAKAFAKEKPWAVGTLAAVLGLATLNTLRGRG